MGAFLRKYATGTHVYIPIIKAGSVNFAVGADWTPSAGDVKVSIDGAAVANIGTLPSAIASGNGAFWDFTISSGETTGKKITVVVSDAATKAVEDQCFVIETYGNASAEYVADFSAANLPANVTQFGGSNGTFASGRPEVNTTHIAGSAVSTSSAQIGVNVVNAAGTAWNSGAIGPNTLASDTLTAAKVAADVGTEIGTAVWATTTRVLTANTNLNDLSAAGVRAAVGLASANLDTQLDGLPTAAENADAVWDEDATGHQTQGTFGQAIGDPGADTDTIFGLVNTNLDATISSRASQSSVNTIDDFVDTEVATIASGVSDIQSRLPAALVSGRIDASVGAMAANTLTAAATAADFSTEVNAAVLSVLGSPAGASVSADVAAIKTETASIQSDTNDIQARLPAALVSGRMDSSVGEMAANTLTASALATDAVTEIAAGVPTVAAIADGVWDESTSGHTTSGTFGEQLKTDLDAVLADTDEMQRGIITGTAATGTLSSTQMTTSLTGYDDDQLIGRVVTFTSGACDGEQGVIDDYASTGGLITFQDPLTTAPSNGDAFKVT